MHSFVVGALALLAVGATAAPAAAHSSSIVPRDDDHCLHHESATKVADNFASLISAYSKESADAYLCSDFKDYSDSVNTLIDGGCPSGPATLGLATFDSRAAFEAGQGSQPNIAFNILNVWHSCKQVIVRWNAPLPNPTTSDSVFNPEEAVTGIAVLETAYNVDDSAEPYLIDTIYSEFNSGAWLTDLGLFKPSNCSASASFKVKRSLDGGVPAAFLAGRV